MSIGVACGVPSVEYKISEPDTAHIIRHSARITSNSNGFTLLEVMVAVSIMALVLVTLLGLKDKTMQDVMLSDHITTATLLAKRMMTDTIMFKPRLPLEDEGEFTEQEFKEYTWKKVISVTPLAQVMEVRVAVLWKEGTRQEMVELVGYE
jgi:general secretion pathway protein I